MESFAENSGPTPPICLVADDVFPLANSENGRRTDQTVRLLLASGVPVILLLTATEQEARQLRSHADRHYPAVRIHTVAELLNDLPPEEDIPLWAFHFSAYWRSYRIAMALRKLCRRECLGGVEFADAKGAGFVVLKWRRMWGDQLAGVPIWVRLHGTLELLAENGGMIDCSLEQQQLYAMERYALQCADGWISPSADVGERYRSKYDCPGMPIVAENACETYREVRRRFQPGPPAACLNPTALVSVVVPYYNMQDYLEATLDSVRASRYPHWEIVAVDDGSTQPAARAKFDALRAKYQGDDRYRFLRKPNGGLGSARNYGIRLARGKYVLPLDSDDLIDARYLDRAVVALERLPELAAVSCFVGYFPDGQRPDRAVDYVIPYDLHPLLIVLENRAGVACSVFRREVFDCVHYDEALTSYEDWELWWQLAEANLPVEVMPMLLYRYRRRENSMVRTTGASSHVQLLSAIASRHVDHLRRYGDLVFRYHLSKIQELRQAAPRRSKPLPWRATAMLRRVCSGMKGL